MADTLVPTPYGMARTPDARIGEQVRPSLPVAG